MTELLLPKFFVVKKLSSCMVAYCCLVFHLLCGSLLVTSDILIAGGGVWAVYPIVFAISYSCGIFHSVITLILSVTTLYTFISAAFGCAGTPPNVLWGSYPTVGKDHLENYTFCLYCSKPKSPRTHHCRCCGKCILDMDHHCPFVSIHFFIQKHIEMEILFVDTVHFEHVSE